MLQVIAAATKGELSLQQQCAIFFLFVGPTNTVKVARHWVPVVSGSFLIAVWRMLQADPTTRLSASQALRHVYFLEKEN